MELSDLGRDGNQQRYMGNGDIEMEDTMGLRWEKHMFHSWVYSVTLTAGENHRDVDITLPVV